MTPFAQLETLEKSAWMAGAGAGPNYHPPSFRQGGIVRPPAWNSPQSSRTAAAVAKPKGQWGVAGNTWADIGLSMIPIAGGVYMGNKAIQDFRQGNIGSGIGNALWAGLSFIPGGGLLRGLAGGVKGVRNLSQATKGLRAAGQVAQPGVAAMSNLNKVQHVARSGWNGSRAAGKTLPGGGGLKTYGTTMGASIAAPMLLDPKQPQQQPQQQFDPPENPLGPQQSWIQMGREQLGH